MLLSDLLIGVITSLINFGIHAVTTALIIVATRHTEERTQHMGMFLRITALLTISVAILMFAHIAEIGVWAASLNVAGIRIETTSTFEFSFENYTALGYGDALPTDRDRRLIGPIMALNGLLLIGWSVAVIFEVMRMAEFQIGNHKQSD
jgi:hypothetical protein